MVGTRDYSGWCVYFASVRLDGSVKNPDVPVWADSVRMYVVAPCESTPAMDAETVAVSPAGSSRVRRAGIGEARATKLESKHQ
jgi:hypothetical protein